MSNPDVFRDFEDTAIGSRSPSVNISITFEVSTLDGIKGAITAFNEVAILGAVSKILTRGSPGDQ
jgi:hypothetical protein